MKKIIIVLCLLVGSLFAYYGGAFSNGYQAGFKAGYCYQEFSCIPPIPPIPPIPEIGESSYMDGYNRGFLDGMNAKR